METRLVLFTLIAMLPFHAFSQDGNYASGARVNGLGNASVALQDPFSIFNNVGAIGRNESSTVMLSYHHRYQMQAFRSITAAYLHNLGDMNLGVSVFQFGDQVFNENKIGLAYGHKINFMSLGIKANRLQYNIEGFGTTSAFVLELGGLVAISPQLNFGAHIYNINQASIAAESNEKIPTIMKAGFTYLPSESFTFSVQLMQDIDYKPTFQGGIEYAIIPQFRFRTGISSHPFVNHFGLGFSPKKFDLDYSLVNDNRLGVSQQLSLAFKFIKNKTDD
ncbi:MAG: hypothetical protein ACOCWM_01840 [Cyclobacteriaceae bacterium]